MSQTVVLNAGDYEALLRKHVRNWIFWGDEVGTDYWLIAGGGTGQLGSAQGELASEHGWTTTSIAANAVGSGADFMVASDKGTPSEFTQNAQNDLIKSPAIFGDWAHAYQAMILLHKKELPRYLIADFICRFSVEANNQPTTAVGFVEDGGSIVTAADHMGAITSNSGTWGLSVNGSEGTAFATADTGVHLFRLVMDKALGRIYPGVDGTMYNGNNGSTDGSLAITADEFPVAFGAGSGGANNLVQLSQAHVFYAWRVPYFV